MINNISEAPDIVTRLLSIYEHLLNLRLAEIT